VSTPDRDRKLEELFQLVVDLSPDERAGFYARHCADDPELRAELEGLVAQDDHGTKAFLQSPVRQEHPRTPIEVRELDDAPEDDGDRGDDGGTGDGVDTGSGSASAASAASAGAAGEAGRRQRLRQPARIGRYRLLEIIGEGGMGTVYLAEQETPVRRRVALKIVRLGMDTKRVVERFEDERQALALMEHPAIARIYDGGTTERGRPYFVMEYAPGLAIQEYCDRERLDIGERLELLCQVCDAVQHAHQKGIIHRDLKPSNVLVAKIDGSHSPKVIDFGIALATSSELAERSWRAGEPEVLGTFYYMSPEQAQGSDVDTRTDVYSLGVLLYELLAGVLPFDGDVFRGKTVSEIRTFLREVHPKAPSERFATLPEEGAANPARTPSRIARARGKSPGRLARRLAGDLDWITRKAMAKDRAERYASASELASDVRRYLKHEPVLAGPSDVSYLISRFIRRNRVAVAGAGLSLSALVAGIVGTTWGMVEASDRRDEAILASEEAKRATQEAIRAREAESEQRLLAEAKAENAKELTEFLVETIALADPEVSANADVTSVLQSAARKVDETGGILGFPQGEALLRRAIGQAFHSGGDLVQAEKHLKVALAIQERDEETPPEELYATMERLAQVYADTDSPSSAELSGRAARLATEIVRRTHPASASRLQALLESLGSLDTGPAIGRLESCNQALRSVPDDDPVWSYVADVYEYAGGYLANVLDKASQGVVFLHDALVIRRRVLPPMHIKLAKSLSAYAEVRCRNGQHSLAKPAAEEALEIYRAAYPSGHWLLSDARSQLGECLSVLGDHARAGEVLLAAHAEIAALRGPQSRSTLNSLRRLVEHFDRCGRPVEAQGYRDDMALAFSLAIHSPWGWGPQRGAFHPRRHAGLIAALDRMDELLRLGMRVELGPGKSAQLADELDRVLSRLNDFDASRTVIVARQLLEWASIPGLVLSPEVRERMLEEAMVVLCRVQEVLPLDVAEGYRQLGRLQADRGEWARAEASYREATRLFDDRLKHSVQTLDSEAGWARCLAALGRVGRAERTLLNRWEAVRVELGAGHDFAARELDHIVGFYEAVGRPDLYAPFVTTHLLERGPGTSPDRLDRWSWLIVRRAGFEAGLYGLALEASLDAAQKAPDRAAYHTTLGAAFYRNGMLDLAVEELTTAVELSGGQNPRDWALLVLVHESRGAAAAAQEARKRLGGFAGRVEDPDIETLRREAGGISGTRGNP